MKKLWADFMKFIMRGNVVDMAVGVAVASAFTAIVTAFTKGFITPLLALLTNNSDLAEMKWIIRPEVTETAADGTVNVITAEVALLWGEFVQKILDFFIIAAALFIVLRIAGSIAEHSKKIRTSVVNALSDADERAAEEAAVAAEKEAEQKALAEAEAAAKEAAIAEEKRKKEERLEREMELLTEIRDLLRESK